MKMYYNPRLKILARRLRKESALSEILLWQELRARQMRGYQFMRQKPIGNYIVDFYCNKLKLVIEIDGESHDHPDAYRNDAERQSYLEKLGLTVLRCDDLDVKQEMEAVLSDIDQWIEHFV